MTGLFCFDGPLYKDVNNVYCNVTLTNEMFERYFTVVDRLIVVVRTFTTDKTYKEMNMKPLLTDKIDVVEVGNLNTIKGYLFDRKKFEKKIVELVDCVDLVFARMPSTVSNSVLTVVQKKNKPYLVEVGGCAWDSYWNHGILGKLIAPAMFYNARKNIAKADFATYVTKSFLQKRYPNNNVTTNCSNVYLKAVGDDILKKRLDKIATMDLKKIVLGQAVNSIDVKYKGEHLVLYAMRKLKELGIMVEFQVAGPGTGDYLKKVAAKCGVSDQLTLKGTLTKDEIFEWYQSIDIYIQPSKQEGLPRSVIEAMSYGCPALGSDLAGIPELLDKECLFDPDVNSQIVDAVTNLLTVDRMIENAKKNFEKAKEYNLQDIEQRRQELFIKYKSMYRKENK